MSTSAWATHALQAFDNVVAAQAHLRPRAGQREMAAQVAHTFAHAHLGKPTEGEDSPPNTAVAPSIAVIQAGTGVGKSLAYSAPAIAMALQRGTRVMISTATVALQEQLVNKDLPALAAHLGQPFRYALAKGRGRFVCQLKLERLVGSSDLYPEEADDLFGETLPAKPVAQAERQAQQQFYASMAEALAQGRWDGDRDSLDTPPAPEAWSPVAAEGSSCTGRHCPAFQSCSYYERRKELVAAQVIVVNHDLLLSSLGARLLPELDNCLLVLDEAHHLPATALAQFASNMDLSRLQWLDKLTSRALRIGQLLEVEEIADIPQHSSGLRQAMGQLAQAAMAQYGETLKSPEARFGPASARIPRGVLPEALLPPLEAVLAHSTGLLDVLRAIAKALRSTIKETPDEAPRLAALYAQLGSLAPRLEAVFATTELLLHTPAPGQAPAAKWFTLEMDGEWIALQAHASPILPGSTLRQHLWSQVRGGVLTSATLTSCGSFDFFLREVGLHDLPTLATLEVASPFDYPSQGVLWAHHTQADPKHAGPFTQEMVHTLLHDLASVQTGALVLFTSKEQMRQAVDALPSALRSKVLVQNTMPRFALLNKHREQVEAGQASIIFGMQSFGEGLDLPGALCASLFITKLPFAPPDDPVGEARAEWLRSSGRNPFTDLVVPATAIRLAQWVGRAIRTEHDQAQVYCYDRRLCVTSYGQQIQKSLPDFSFQQRFAQLAHN
ncbi:ATP-dependent DNA helicase DinG [Comamonas denitrificans]|uniref:ATP-dependent DNA helicase DinG n=1 Tax=Comamonas denitrificans TaxID=117506 RepID=A0A939GZ99_9BURK|nr:ATP-dependent DNA helicase DinG [Comamonas denitrificans]MBO1249996.1 ATP-dependent DNA helicase DinG [Comamonas denitrificans]